MAAITTIQPTDMVDDSREVINQNFDNLNTELGGVKSSVDNLSTVATSGKYSDLSGAPAFSTTEQAEAGTDDTTIMTPQKVKESILENAPDPEVATQSEAEAGTDNTKFMTPLRVKQNIDTRIATAAEVEAGTDNTKFITPATAIVTKLVRWS